MKWLGCISIAFILSGTPLFGQETGDTPSVFEDLAIQEQLGEQIAKDVLLRDENGEMVTVAQYLSPSQPTILNFVYHECPMLCSILLESFAQTLSEMEWKVGEEFQVVTVSFSAQEQPELARRVKDRYINNIQHENAEAGWHFLTGDEQSIATLTQSAGFKYRWMDETKEYAHPAALLFLAGDGTITRYLHGLSYEPRDVRSALVEASAGRVGTVIDKIAMFCYRYDPASNSYVLQATQLMKLGGALMLVVLGFVLTFFWKRERKHQRFNLRSSNPKPSVIHNG